MELSLIHVSPLEFPRLVKMAEHPDEFMLKLEHQDKLKILEETNKQTLQKSLDALKEELAKQPKISTSSEDKDHTIANLQKEIENLKKKLLEKPADSQGEEKTESVEEQVKVE